MIEMVTNARNERNSGHESSGVELRWRVQIGAEDYHYEKQKG